MDLENGKKKAVVSTDSFNMHTVIVLHERIWHSPSSCTRIL
jgi:hypothetical protein